VKLCAIEPKELEEKILIRFAENQNDELLEDLSDYVINSQKEIERLNNIINELEKELYKIRELTFTKYNSNEWNNCLSFNDDILPVINKIKELKGSEKE